MGAKPEKKPEKKKQRKPKVRIPLDFDVAVEGLLQVRPQEKGAADDDSKSSQKTSSSD